MNTLKELSEKRKRQSHSALVMSLRLESMKQMTDEEIRFYNIRQDSKPLEIKGVTIDEIYKFALNHYSRTGEDILNTSIENIGEKDKTLLWSMSAIAQLIDTRKMTQEQYSCLERAADKYLQHQSQPTA